MKTLFTFLTIVLFFATVEAKVVYLNNNLEAPIVSENLYTNWNDAYASVLGGDTIYVIGSNLNYGKITFDKPIILIGPGYFLASNPDTQVSKLPAEFGYIQFLSGSEGTSLIGISSSVNNYIDMKISVSEITLIRCYFKDKVQIYRGSDNININNLVIKQCYFNSQVDGNNLPVYNGVFNNFTFTNNIVKGSFYIPNGSTGIIAFNLFANNYFQSGLNSSLEIANNVYLNSNTSDFRIQPLPDASVHHNISLTGAFGSNNGNITAPQSTLFVSNSGTSDDGKYMLSENSPAKSAGSNGNDIGPFGGPDPYCLSGLPNLPNIYQLSTVGLVSGDKLQVTIKIKQ